MTTQAHHRNQNYIVATIKPWNLEAFARWVPRLPGNWVLIDDPKLLTLDAIKQVSPRYIFFPHWSWRVPSEIFEPHECVCFHMSDLPYGRGGSPLQNLIARGHKATRLTALRMTSDYDAGPIYLKRPLSLEGRAIEIFERSAELTCEMMQDIALREPEPASQDGVPAVFDRRTPSQSVLPSESDAHKLYDHIRMLDAPSYPAAFLDWENWRLEFSEAKLIDETSMEARVVFRRKTT